MQLIGDLTKLEVEALKECLDFLSCGYRVVSSFYDSDKWIIHLRHMRNLNRIKIVISEWSYTIEKNHRVVKLVSGSDSGHIDVR